MKLTTEAYEAIPGFAIDIPSFFMHIPGIYCINCKEVFALYSFSAGPPDGFDRWGKPIYFKCDWCPDEDGEPHIAKIWRRGGVSEEEIQSWLADDAKSYVLSEK